MIRKGSLSALLAAACLWLGGVLVPWLLVVTVWRKIRGGV